MTPADGGPRILVISSSSPLPPDRGGAQRTHLLLRALQGVAAVDLAYLHWDLEPLDPSVESGLREEFGLKRVLRPRGGPGGSPARTLLWKARAQGRTLAARAGVTAFAYARDRGCEREVRRLLDARPYDLVVVRYLLTAAVTTPFGDVPVIVDADDFEPTRFRAAAAASTLSPPARLAGRLALRTSRRRLAGLLARCDHLWVPSEPERRDVSGPPVTLLPNIPFDPPAGTPAPAPDSATILLVASLRYRVNVRSVDRFLRGIWPRIAARRPDATIRIVGTGMPEDRRRAWSAIPGIEVVGFAEDLAAEYGGCLFTVAPIFHGGGSKIKVLESLAHGRACVTTPHAHAGFEGELLADRHLAVAGDPEGFADLCVAFLDEPDLARRQAERGLERVRERYSFPRFAAIVERTVTEVAGR